MECLDVLWYYLHLFVTETETSWVYSAVEEFEDSSIALTWVTSLVNKKSEKSSFSDVSSSLGEMTKLEAGFTIFFVVGAKNECQYVGHKLKLVSKWSFQAKIQCKNKGFELKLTEEGGTIQYILFPGIKLTL